MKKTFKALILIVIVVVAVAGALLLGNKGSDEGVIKIGLISSLTGPWPDVGLAVKNGATLALEDSQTGKGGKYQLIVEDDGVDLKKGLSAYKKLVDVDKVSALINVSSPTLEPIVPLLKNTDIPFVQIAEQPTAPSGNRLVQISPYSIESAAEMAHLLESKYSSNEIALVYKQDSTVSLFVNKFEESLNDKNINKQATNTNTSNGSRDYRNVALRVVASKPKVVLIALFEDEEPLLIKEIERVKTSDIQYAFMFVHASLNQDKKVLGDLSALNNAIVPVFKEYSSQVFRDKYKKRFGMDPVWGAEYGYDAVTLLIKTHNNNPEKWRADILKESFIGESGPINFNELGLRPPEFKLKEIVGGELPVY